MIREFQDFIKRGNVLDMAVGVIVGGAFGKIVTSLVNDILMPAIGMLLGKVNFSNLFINLGETHYDTLADAKAAGVATINYGLFLNTILDFLIVAAVIFLVVRQISKVRSRFDRSKPVPGPPTTKECPYCLSTIPVKAVRCGQCTSQLAPAGPEPL